MELSCGILSKLADRILSSATIEERALLAWPLVCGGAVAARTKALRCESDELIVEVPDQTWRYQLAALSIQYLAAVQSLAGKQIQKIVFVVGPETRSVR